jgi:hypothetical protein
MEEENLYHMSDDKIKEIEELILSAEENSENSEDFINKVFPNLSSEDKLKIAMFANVFVENFCISDEDDIDYEEEIEDEDSAVDHDGDNFEEDEYISETEDKDIQK